MDDKDHRIRELEYEVLELRRILRLAREAHDSSAACVRCQSYECHTVDGLCRQCLYDDLDPRGGTRNEPSVWRFLFFKLNRKFRRKKNA